MCYVKIRAVTNKKHEDGGENVLQLKPSSIAGSGKLQQGRETSSSKVNKIFSFRTGRDEEHIAMWQCVTFLKTSQLLWHFNGVIVSASHSYSCFIWGKRLYW